MQIILTLAALQHIIAAAAEEIIITVIAIERVVAAIAVKIIRAVAAMDSVIADDPAFATFIEQIIAVDDVIACTAPNSIAPGTAGNLVIAGSGINGVLVAFLRIKLVGLINIAGDFVIAVFAVKKILATAAP